MGQEEITFNFDVIDDDGSDVNTTLEKNKEVVDNKPKQKDEKKEEKPLETGGDDSKKDTPTLEGVIEKEEENSDSTDLDFSLENNSDDKTYSEIAKDVLGDNFSLIIQDDSGEDKEVSLDDYNISKEELNELLKNYVQEEKEQFKKNSISTKGLDETTVSIINAVKNSRGNFEEVTSLMNLKDKFVDPLKNLDLDDEKDQVKAIRMRYESDSKYDSELIDDLILAAKTKGELREKAEKSIEDMSKVIKTESDRLNKELEQREEGLKKQLREYRKTLVSDLTEKFDIKESLAKKISDFAGKETFNEEKGMKMFDIDTMYMQARQDKDIASDLALFLYDGGKTYRKYITEKLKYKVNVENQKKIRLNRQTGSHSGGKVSGDKEKTIPFDKFF